MAPAHGACPGTAPCRAGVAARSAAWRGPVEEHLPCRLEAPGQALTAASFSGKFLADNIVGSVLVFSLMLWIPVSILVHCVVSCPLVRL